MGWFIIVWLVCSILTMILTRKDGPMPVEIWVILLLLGPIGLFIWFMFEIS